MKKMLLLARDSWSMGAGSSRMKSLVRLFSSNGFYCKIYTTSVSPAGEVNDESPNYQVCSLGDPSKLHGFAKVNLLLFGKDVAEKILSEEKPDFVVVYSTLRYSTAKFIKSYCLSHHIPLVFDVVEFRQLFASFSPKAFFLFNYHNNRLSKKLIDSKVGVICPTHFLMDYFAQKRHVANLFLFPITFHLADLPKYKKDPSIKKITYLYAGTPNQKRDLLANMIKGFNMLEPELQEKIAVYFCGNFDKEKLVEEEGVSIDDIKKSLSYAVYPGQLSHAELYKLYSNIDYSILLKNETKQFSKAGFPTKMSESFGIGVPMVTNFSGDIKYYAIDGINCFIAKGHGPEGFKLAVERSILEYEDKHAAMSASALNTAKDHFEIDLYISGFSTFIQKCNETLVF
jgi:glycosyltransferase involved in cell wall biosynthesis